MNYLRFILVLVYLSFHAISAERSTRERIEMHKKWIEEHKEVKKLISQNASLSHPKIIEKRYWVLPYYHRRNPSFRHYSKYSDNSLKQKSTQNEVLTELERERSKSIKASATTTSTSPKLTTAMTSTTTTTTTTTAPTTPSAALTTISATARAITALKLKNDVMKAAIDRPINTTKLMRRHYRAAWDKWQPWTICSRTCGGGVMSQSRQCLSRIQSSLNRTSNECIGLYKRFRICNDQSCPDHEIDFREQQCVAFNEQDFRGVKYTWEAYFKDDAECELNCKPINMNYYATLNETVIDGTQCYSPVDFVFRNHSGRAMCVDGICKAVRNSGIITGAFLNNGAVRCGTTVCRPVSIIFDKNPLPNGYIHIATIPAGASNISILELRNSDNLLVLKRFDKSFIMNGDHIVSNSGEYKAAGAKFDYRRIDGPFNMDKNRKEGVTEWITATGSITEPIYLMVLNHRENPGVKYEYLMPINIPHHGLSADENNSIEMEADMPPSAQSTEANLSKEKNSSGQSSGERRKHRYGWKVVKYSSCSKSCGGGILTPIIRCVREGTNKFYNHKRCAHTNKPTLSDNALRCNSQPCPAFWKIDEWTACNCGLPNEHKDQTREVKCVQEVGNGIVMQVIEAACLEEKPPSKQECVCPRVHNRRIHHSHHKGVFRAPVTLIGNSTIGKRVHLAENKKAGVWLTSEWNGKCSTICGDGVESRSIFCDRSHPNTDRCDFRQTPDISRQCRETSGCEAGEWFSGPWSECGGDCFSLTRSRSVLCVKNGKIVADIFCVKLSKNNSSKPEITQQCDLESVSYCKPRWHSSDWSECTKTCGSGTQRRVVKCFEPQLGENSLSESDECRYAERPGAFRSCNTQKCEEESSTSSLEEESIEFKYLKHKKHPEPKVELIQNDSLPACVDNKSVNCAIAVKAKLCSYDYYTKNCCATCKMARNKK